ncbi:MAG TPA: DUF4124 domain-containing protein [Usitatibacter sp.]|jgi:hypothetical protein|nr:DUF4124 domain-containing protein [Usitatibacter sp.]
MRRILALALAASLPTLPAPASTLYKSIGPNGVIQFSDTPPDNGQVVAQLALPEGNAPPRADAGAPLQPPTDFDAALDTANQKLDLAEHALAEARRSVWTEPDVLHIGGPHMARADCERIAYYEKGVRHARLAVADLMRRRLKAEASNATVTAGNDWVPVPLPFRTADRR